MPTGRRKLGRIEVRISGLLGVIRLLVKKGLSRVNMVINGRMCVTLKEHESRDKNVTTTTQYFIFLLLHPQ